jgi:hypothetical protein
VQDSDIFSNRTAGVYAYGGTVHALSNWWGDESGPYHNTQNVSGKGNAYVGEGSFAPWSIKNKEKCCSSVLFIPGIQGSRLYKSSLIGENQLWEPNYHSDIKKLLMNTAGKAIDSGIYTRDIIERTNITHGGSFDVDVYDGFVEFLNNLQKNYSIEDFSVFPYDWRSSAKDIAVYGARYKTDKNVIVHRQLTQEVERLSLVSKTRKVTLISHSYGGLVIKELLHALYLSGKISLIDKVIFVGTPDNGSLVSLGSLLHGDNQDIGNGLIVNTYTMREFAQNLPSVYQTLPKSSEQLIKGLATSTTVYKPIPDITGVVELQNFLKNTAQRPTDTYFREINVPAPVNSVLLDSYFRAGSGLTSVPDVSGNVSEDTSYFDTYPKIQFFNILGVGISTPRVLEYMQKRCPTYISHPMMNSKNCGLDHRYIDSNIGDGVVLAEDVLQQNEYSQNRWGEKYVINIGEYNRKHVSGFSHSTLVSSPPVVSLLSRIITNSIDSPGLPTYVTKHGGVRSSVNSVQGFAGDIGPTAQHDYVLIEHSDFMRSSIFEYATSTESHYKLIDINPLFVQVVPKKPNTQTRLVSDVIQIRSESNADKIVLSMSEYVRNPDPVFDLRIKTVSGNTSSTVSFVGIPVSENSIATVTREGEDVHMKIENVYDQVATTSVEYILNKDNPALIHSEDFPPFREVLDRAMVQIRSSNLRNNFKDRYLRKIESIKNKYSVYEKEKEKLALMPPEPVSSGSVLDSIRKVTVYTEQIKKSVQTIHAELKKENVTKYKGGMFKAEAAFLSDQFLYIQKALVYNLKKL